MAVATLKPNASVALSQHLADGGSLVAAWGYLDGLDRTWIGPDDFADFVGRIGAHAHWEAKFLARLGPDASRDDLVFFVGAYLDRLDTRRGLTVDAFFGDVFADDPPPDPAPAPVVPAESTAAVENPGGPLRYTMVLSPGDTAEIVGLIAGTIPCPVEINEPLKVIEYPLVQLHGVILHVMLVRGETGLWVDAYATAPDGTIPVVDQVGPPSGEFFRTYAFLIGPRGIELELRRG